MKRSNFDNWQDRKVADDSVQDRALMCSAHGCPNRWSVTGCDNRTCCSAHAWASPHLWPQITQEQLDAQTDRALRNASRVHQPEPVANVRRLREELAKLGNAIRVSTQNPKAWAHRLKAREEAGARLNDNQSKAWREVLS